MCGQVIKQSVVLFHTAYTLHTMRVTETYCASENTNVNSTETQRDSTCIEKCKVQANNDVLLETNNLTRALECNSVL